MIAEEMLKQKFLRKLLVMQEVVHPRDLLSFESIKVLLSQKPLTTTRYEALALLEGLEVTSDRELDSSTALKVYVNALRLLGAAMESGKPSAKLAVTLDLSKGIRSSRKTTEGRD
jgi:hypothetical protein